MTTPHSPRPVTWVIRHPGTGETLTCESFYEAMTKWFEGFNVPVMVTDGIPESFESANARVKAHYARGAVTLSSAEVAQIAQESAKFAPGPLSQPEPEGGVPVGWGAALRAIAAPDAATQGSDSLGAAGGELLPCPFCGAKAVVNEHNKRVAINCEGLECLAQQKGPKEAFRQIVRLWNTRTPVPAPAAASDVGGEYRVDFCRHGIRLHTPCIQCDDEPKNYTVAATPPPSAPVARYGTPNSEFLALQGYITEENPGFVKFLRYAEGLANRYDAIRAEVDFWKTDADHWRKAFEEQRGDEAFITTQSSLVESRAEVARLKEELNTLRVSSASQENTQRPKDS